MKLGELCVTFASVDDWILRVGRSDTHVLDGDSLQYATDGFYGCGVVSYGPMNSPGLL